MAKRIGHKAKLYRDAYVADPTTLLIAGMPAGVLLVSVKSFTPPTKAREKIDFTDLSSSIVEHKPSDPPDVGELVLDVFWHPTDSNAALIDDIFDEEDPDDNESTWCIEYPFALKIYHVFTGWISSCAPGQVQSKEGISRTVTIVLTSKIHELEEVVV